METGGKDNDRGDGWCLRWTTVSQGVVGKRQITQASEFIQIAHLRWLSPRNVT